jgi:hypothetical protein
MLKSIWRKIKPGKSREGEAKTEQIHPSTSQYGVNIVGAAPHFGPHGFGSGDNSKLTISSSNSIVPAASLSSKPSPWSHEDEFVLKANKVIASLAGDILAIYLTVKVLRQTGRSAFVSEKTTFWNMFLLYTIRPRIAPFTGILGFMKGWSRTGLADVFSDALLSGVSGIFVGTHFIRYYWLAPLNPVAPAQQLKLLAISAFIAGGPTVLGLMTGLMGIVPIAGEVVDNTVAAVSLTANSAWGVIWGFIFRLGALGLFICAIPFIAILEILTMLHLAIRGQVNRNNSKHDRVITWLEEPLKVRNRGFVCVYGIIVLCSWVTNAGNWMFFTLYLNLEGEAYCPSSSLYVSLIWIFIPFAVRLPLEVLGWYIGQS